MSLASPQTLSESQDERKPGVLDRAARISAALGITLVLAAGCSRSDRTQTQTIPEDRSAPASGTEPRQPSRYRGLYTHAGASDSASIVLCEGEALRVQDGTGGELRRAHEALGGTPSQAVFLEVRGVRVAAPEGPTRLDVIELVRATPVGEGAGCAEAPARYRFRASGNEPFWSATVGKDSVVFEQPDEPRRIAAPLTRRDEGASRRTFQAETGEHVIRVSLSPARCTDSMSGAIYSFSAEVVVDERSLSGCARAGDLGEAP